MEAVLPRSARPQARKRLNLFERYLSVWVAACMAAGLALGRWAPDMTQRLRDLELGQGTQINLPIALLIWLMIVPMMMKVDVASIRHVGKRPTGLLVTLFVNWLVKPFSMAFIAWVFFRIVFAAWISPAEADQYIAGAIILAAAPCTAMVFVWSYLTEGDPAYTLVQVSVNDLIMLVLFAPLVALLVAGTSSLAVPFQVLFYSVIAFIVIPLVLGTLLRMWSINRYGRPWFEQRLLPKFGPVTIMALLATLICIFAFQADNITGRYFHVVLIAIPILLQVYFNSSLAYGLMRLFNVPYSIAAPGALIGASNFFELAVARPLRCTVPDPARRWSPSSVCSWKFRLCCPSARSARERNIGSGEVVHRESLFVNRCEPMSLPAYRSTINEKVNCTMKKRVLFVCTGNSARSQMAEGLLRHLCANRFDVASAGTHPVAVNPFAVEAMEDIGIDISLHRSKGIAEFMDQHFDYAITVCDSAHEACPFSAAPLLDCIGAFRTLRPPPSRSTKAG